MKSFLNYFASKMTLLNILQNVVMYLFKYFVLRVMVILQNDTFPYYKTNQIFVVCIILCCINEMECSSGTIINQILNV